jgi:hypothetical protein
MTDTSQGQGWWLASDGKWYPPQSQVKTAPPPIGGYGPPPVPGYGAPPPVLMQQKKGHGCLYAFLAVMGIGLILVIVLVEAVGTAAKRISDNATAGNLGGPAPAAKYSIGQTARTAGFDVTVFAVIDPQAPSQFETPPAGDHFVSVDIAVRNPGSSQQAFSSFIGLHLLDSLNHQYNESLGSISPPTPDGQIAAGQTVRGLVLFEVPDGTTGLKLRVQGSLTAAGAVWTLD